MASCPPVPVWAGMSMNDTATHYGAAIRYWCEETYQFPDLESWRETECTYRGVWSPGVIDCVGKCTCTLCAHVSCRTTQHGLLILVFG